MLTSRPTEASSCQGSWAVGCSAYLASAVRSTLGRRLATAERTALREAARL
jgi:hypothetical protein